MSRLRTGRVATWQAVNSAKNETSSHFLMCFTWYLTHIHKLLPEAATGRCLRAVLWDVINTGLRSHGRLFTRHIR